MIPLQAPTLDQIPFNKRPVDFNSADSPENPRSLPTRQVSLANRDIPNNPHGRVVGWEGKRRVVERDLLVA